VRRPLAASFPYRYQPGQKTWSCFVFVLAIGQKLLVTAARQNGWPIGVLNRCGENWRY
jgi:hypothetical protein